MTDDLEREWMPDEPVPDEPETTDAPDVRNDPVPEENQ